jgi:plasmid stabilization system protein ParE
MKVTITRTADRDLLEGFLFYERQCKGIGHYFLNSLMADIDALLLFAGIHRRVEGFHRLLSRRFPYAIFYEMEGDEIRVLRVIDTRRDPRWIARQLRKTR